MLSNPLKRLYLTPKSFYRTPFRPRKGSIEPEWQGLHANHRQGCIEDRALHWSGASPTPPCNRRGDPLETFLSTSDFQSEVVGEIGGELPAKFGRRSSSFFCWGKSSEAVSTKTPPQISPSNFTTRFWVVAGPTFWEMSPRLSKGLSRFSMMNALNSTVQPVLPVLVIQPSKQRNRTRTTSSTVLETPLSGTRTKTFHLVKEKKTHKHKTNLRDCPGIGRVAKFCLCVFFGSFLMGGENTHKQKSPQNPGTTPWIFCLRVFIFMFFWGDCLVSWVVADPIAQDNSKRNHCWSTPPSKIL